MNELNNNEIWWRSFFSIVDSLKNNFDITQPFKTEDLTMTQLKVLKIFFIEDSNNGCMLKDLAYKLHQTPSATSQTVDSLVNMKMLIREHSEVDRRAITIKLSQELYSLKNKAQNFFTKMVVEAVEDITPQELEIFTKILKHIDIKLKENEK